MLAHRRVLVDATMATSGGGYTYLVNMIPALAGACPETEFLVLIRTPALADVISPMANLEIRVLPQSGLLGRIAFLASRAATVAAEWEADIYLSVAEYAPRGAHCPVVVVRPGPHDAGDHVLALIDGTPAGLEVIEFAVRHASAMALPLHVEHLLWTAYELEPQLVEGARRLLAEACAGLGEKFPDVEVTSELRHFTNPEELIEAATDAALVVVGHHPASRMHRILYRSVSSEVLEHASVPVAVVPTPQS